MYPGGAFLRSPEAGWRFVASSAARGPAGRHGARHPAQSTHERLRATGSYASGTRASRRRGSRGSRMESRRTRSLAGARNTPSGDGRRSPAERISLRGAVQPEGERGHGPVVGHEQRSARLERARGAGSGARGRQVGLDLGPGRRCPRAGPPGGRPARDEEREHDERRDAAARSPAPPRVASAVARARARSSPAPRAPRTAPASRPRGTGSARAAAGRRSRRRRSQPVEGGDRQRQQRPPPHPDEPRGAARTAAISSGQRRISPSRQGTTPGTLPRPVGRSSSAASEVALP